MQDGNEGGWKIGNSSLGVGEAEGKGIRREQGEEEDIRRISIGRGE